MTHYKVWVSVEELDEEADTYQDIGLPDWIADFETIEEARAHVLSLLYLLAPNMIATSDQVPPGLGYIPGPELCPRCGAGVSDCATSGCISEP